MQCISLSTSNHSTATYVRLMRHCVTGLHNRFDVAVGATDCHVCPRVHCVTTLSHCWSVVNVGATLW